MKDLATVHERIKYLVDNFAGGRNTVFAAKLGISEANIRGYIKGVIPKADVLEKIVITYDVDAMWLLTGLGEESHTSSSSEHSILATKECMQSPQKATPSQSQEAVPAYLLTMLSDKDALIQKQAKEIGKLEQQLAELKQRFEKDVEIANIGNTANAG